MKTKRKVILALKKNQSHRRPREYVNEERRHLMIRDFLSSGLTKQDIWEKYMGHNGEHGHLLRWMRQLGYPTDIPIGTSNFDRNTVPMSKKKATPSNEDAFETQQLKKRITDLEKQLNDAELKAIAFSMMVDIAEKEFNIPIRKKLNTKPSKK